MKRFFSFRGGKFLVLILLATVFIAGCTIRIGSSGGSGVTGVFKSFDKGNTWVEKNLFFHSNGLGSINRVNVINLTFDPQDRLAIYLAADGSGLLFSYDGANSWQKAKQVGDGRILSVAVDPKNKCVIYATFANTILKTVDCSRGWSEIYIDTRADKAVTALALDSFNNLVVYAGNSAGDILKSSDGGINWRVIHRIDNPIKKILIDFNDTRILYVASQNRGIFKTTNAGTSWAEINDGLRQYSGAFEYKDLIFDLTLPDALLLIAKYGLLKTEDGGRTWQAISLITPPASTDIFAVAISPVNNQEIYYATASTFYKTVDGGKNWITKRLPSNARASYLAVDPLDPNVLYLGLANPTR